MSLSIKAEEADKRRSICLGIHTKLNKAYDKNYYATMISIDFNKIFFTNIFFCK